MRCEERFWMKVDKEGLVPDLAIRLGRCWVWTASLRNKGYGAFVYCRNGEVVQGRAHRFSWELHFGPIPTDMCVLHRCDNPSCVRPSHLFLGTKRDNNIDMVSKGRHVPGGTYRKGRYVRGRRHWNCRLTERQVSGIRTDRAAGMSFSAIATKHGISIAHAYRISKGLSRKGSLEEGGSDA